tara:strand:+ start:97 stop:609 length:513 start_codon:yes stop_codon:yes gene_type:complete
LGRGAGGDLNISRRAMVATKIEQFRHGGDRKSDQDANLQVDRAAAVQQIIRQICRITLLQTVVQRLIEVNDGPGETDVRPDRQYTLQDIVTEGYVRLSVRTLRSVVQSMGFAPASSSGKYLFSTDQVREIQEHVGASKRQDRALTSPPRETAREVIARRRREAAEKKNRG